MSAKQESSLDRWLRKADGEAASRTEMIRQAWLRLREPIDDDLALLPEASRRRLRRRCHDEIRVAMGDWGLVGDELFDGPISKGLERAFSGAAPGDGGPPSELEALFDLK